MASVYLSDLHNRRRFLEFTESLCDVLVELAECIDELNHGSLDQARRAKILNDIGVLSGDSIADIDILLPILKDVYSKRVMLRER